mmetsp:Transcript_34241/g.54585  ORF Transcript_34241/g.54585 Transcript_34241/m.54585 type:complete len:179 (+) Transcript_34241:57-593(+)|eukprot:CAMPEP_0169110788 /NCGR_PEP_ID=MMETSP1015-20121227/26706_1 /TAXON_ID=342587 /ORGANISM="Karlodinium micrum, Strain CCMP2283" /LENGTH=178 /DNA_ID=CAMNT_0009172617 /DNA_START=52 /DNA_END=588 /DNA_ORIENTATION=-
MARLGLIAELFAACDTDGDGRITSGEMRLYAEQTGFDGSDIEWSEAFSVLCDERNVHPERGFDRNAWEVLLTDSDEGNACFCSDSDLPRILAVLKGEANVKTTSPLKVVSRHLTHCSCDHILKFRVLHGLEGRVNASRCQACRKEIPRKESRYSCKACHYNICRDCHPTAQQACWSSE